MQTICKRSRVLGWRCRLLLALGLVASAAWGQPPGGDGAPTVRIGTDPRVALHMLARTGAVREEVPALAELSELAAAVEDAAGSARVWLVVEPWLLSAEPGPVRLDGLPLERVAGGNTPEARTAVEAYLRGLESGADTFVRAGRESGLLTALDRRADMLRGALVDAGLLADSLAALGLDAAGEIRMELIPVAPPPGAMTYRTGSGPVCVVGERGMDDDTLLEVVLHESIHAFDSLAGEGREDSLGLLRRALSEAGLDEPETEFRAAWHALFFVHAAEMVRRAGRPDYVDYGERFGVYERSGPAARVLREGWPGVLDGSTPRAGLMRDAARAAAGG